LVARVVARHRLSQLDEVLWSASADVEQGPGYLRSKSRRSIYI
jgi:hypothetical protein